MKKCSAHEHDDPMESNNMSIIENGLQISSSAVLPLLVKDPRTLNKNVGVVVPDAKLAGNEEFQSKERSAPSLPKHDAEFEHEYGDLWDASKVVDPPVEESLLYAEKHLKRKELFCLGHKGPGSQNATVDKQQTRSCPVLLLKHGNIEESITRYVVTSDDFFGLSCFPYIFFSENWAQPIIFALQTFYNILKFTICIIAW